MSVSDKDISRVSGSGTNGVDAVDGDDESGGVHSREDYRKKKPGGNGGKFSRNLGKAKKVVLRSFTRSKKQIPTNIQTRASSSLSASALNIANFQSKRTWGDDGVPKGCYFCFRQPQTLESSVESPVSDPNDPNYTSDMLKVLIEKNDFYSKECNPHLDIDSSHRKD